MNDWALFLIAQSDSLLSSGLQQLRLAKMKDREEKTSSNAISIHENIV